MSDYLVRLGRSGAARRMVSALGLPVSLPEELRRGQGPWQQEECSGSLYVLGGGKELGAYITSVGGEWLPEEQAKEGEDGPRVHGLVYDLRGKEGGAEGLGRLYQFFHGRIRSLSPSGRVVVVADDPEFAKTAGQAAMAAGAEGFVRSVSKEIGRKGSTANLLTVAPGAEAGLEGVLRFVLSPRSAFISGQPFRVRPGIEHAEAPRWVKPLEGKVAMVTGAARGIGAATARRLAEEGARVVCLDRPDSMEPLSALAQELRGDALELDVTDADAPQALADYLKAEHGGLDIAIHNAGVTRDRTLGRMNREWWSLALQVNLQAVLDIQEALVQQQVFRPEGRVICLSSIAGIAGNVGQSNYAAAKSALIGFVRHCAPIYREKQLSLFAIAPGFIETRMTEAIPFVTREGARRLASLGQGGLPEDVAELLTFLASPGSSGLSGQVIRICGGSFVGA